MPGSKDDAKASRPVEDDGASKPAQSEQAEPTDKAPENAEKDQDKAGQKAEEKYVPPPIEPEDPVSLAACLKQLDTLGVTYKQADPIDESNGCGIDYPLVVTSLGAGIVLKPEGKMRCATTLALTRWTQEIVVPALKIARPGDKLIGIDQASTYVCRKRNSAETGKISEHAHGNAVDIAGFRLKSGDSFSIKPRFKDSTMDGALQRAITGAACLYFTTVLDPGSDKAHETHLHLDVIKRRNDFRYCW